MAWPKDDARYLPPVKSKAQARIDQGIGGTIAGNVGRAAALPARAQAAAVSTLAKYAPITPVIKTLSNWNDRLSADRQGRLANTARVENSRSSTSSPDRSKFAMSLNSPKKALRPDREIPGMGPLMAAPGAKPPQQIGGNIPDARKALIEQYSGRGSVQRPRQNGYSGTQQVGNMDVTFDKSTPLAARKAFMEQPVAPIGQNIQYQKYANTPMGKTFGVQKEPPVNTPGPLNTFGDIMREKARRSLIKDQSAIATAEGGLYNDADRNRISEEGNAMTYALGVDRNNVDVRGQDLLAQSATERNNIDRMNAEANSQTAQIDAEGKNLDIREKLAKERDYAKYSDPKTTDEERQAISRKWGMKTERQEYGTLDQFDAEGNRTGQTLYNKATGEIAGGAKTPEMEIINSNPQYSAVFNAATPERQQEMLAELRKRLAQSAK